MHFVIQKIFEYKTRPWNFTSILFHYLVHGNVIRDILWFELLSFRFVMFIAMSFDEFYTFIRTFDFPLTLTKCLCNAGKKTSKTYFYSCYVVIYLVFTSSITAKIYYKVIKTLDLQNSLGYSKKIHIFYN